MAQGPGNLIYVTEIAGRRGASRSMSRTGARKVVADGLAGPEGIDVGPDGRLYVAEVGQKRVVAIDPATGAKTVIASNLDIGLAPFPGGPPALVPTGVAVGEIGHGLCQLRHPQRALQADAALTVRVTRCPAFPSSRTSSSTTARRWR